MLALETPACHRSAPLATSHQVAPRQSASRRAGSRNTPAALVATALAASLLLHCSVNPATGKHQLALVSEAQEIEIGRQADQQFVAEIGIYPDTALGDYVSGLGKAIAAGSERPHLPWTFRVADDPTVNAFALPGGFVYVTRGILAHLGSEAELVAVLGHEIGHVTGRHSVEQMSKQQLASVGLIAGMVLAPDLARYGGLAETGLGLLLLKYGRDHERQADDLGLRYTVARGYDPREMPKVFTTLGRVTAEAGAGRLPSWLSTHPDPADRVARINADVAGMGQDFASAKVARDPYLRRLDGLVFGPDPREGYFEGRVFNHPEMAFTFTLPAGWKGQNGKQAVTGLAPSEDAMVRVTLADAGSPDEAMRKFFAQQNVARGQALDGMLPTGRNLAGNATTFTVEGGEQSADLAGVVGWVTHRGKVLQLLGLATAERWSGHRDPLVAVLQSFGPLTDRRKLDVAPARLDLVELQSGMTVEQLAARYPSSVDARTLATVNGIEPGGSLPAGTLAKRIVGGSSSG